MKKYILLLFVALIYACSSEDDSQPIVINDDLSNFDIELVETDLTTASIVWSKVTSPNGSNVTYDIYLNDQINLDYTLVEAKYATNKYNFLELESGVDYFVKVIAKDNDGLEKEQTITFATVPNLVPEGLEVSVENIEAYSATLRWTEATDPEGKKVTYDVYVNDALVIEGLSDLTYDLTELEENTEYNVKVVAKDADGFTSEVFIKFTTSLDLAGSYSEDDNGTITELGGLHSGEIFYYGETRTSVEFDLYLYDEETNSRFYFYVATTNKSYNFEEQEFVLYASDHRIIEASFRDSSGNYPEWYFSSVKLTLKRISGNTYNVSFVFDTFYGGGRPVKSNANLIGEYVGELTFSDES